MKEKNTLDRTFGPVGSIAGIIVFIAGFILLFFRISGIVLLAIGAFAGFSSSGTIIDYDKRRIKFCNNIFGIIRTGKWIFIESTMKLGIKKSDEIYSSYSQGNRTLDISKNDFRIFLSDSMNREIMIIKKCGSIDAAKYECGRIADKLELQRV